MILRHLFLRNTKTLALCLLVTSTTIANAQQFLGAKEVIRRQNALKEKPDARNKEINEYNAALPTMTPQQAGEKWALLAIHSATQQEVSFMEAMAVLPPPASWPAIAATFEQKNAKPELKLLAALLTTDRAKQVKYLNALATSKAEEGQTWMSVLNFAVMWQDVEMANKAIDKLIVANNVMVAKNKEAYDQGGAFDFPELSLAFGKEKATAMILKLLKGAKFPLNFGGNASEKIAVALTRQYGNTFPIHHCEFIKSLETADLYPLFNKWFPNSSGAVKLRARSAYVFSKVIKGEGEPFLKEANILENIESSFYGGHTRITSVLERPEIAKLAYPFYEKALKANPKLSLWDSYGTIVFAANKIDEAIPMFKTALKLPVEKRDYSRTMVANLLVRAVAVKGTDDEVAKVVLENLTEENGLAETAMKLGEILKRPDLIAKAKEIAKKSPDAAVPKLIEEGKYAEAEALIAANAGVQRYDTTTPNMLLHLYYKAGRYQDVIDLLDLSPDWYVADIKDLRDGYSGSGETNTLYEVAVAFMKTGKPDVGMKVLLRSIENDPKDDDAYELLVKTLGDEASLKVLDSLFAQDIFEERPLIWKAIALQNMGKLDEAELSVRKAIAIDPSDGDMGKDKRMLGYKVLSQILAKKGNEKDSKFFMTVVDAIRLSERADDYLEAGLVRQAIKMYGDSLKIFSDAYCIQSRIAVNLASEGKTAEAIEHFKRAFELMPDSFGRVETHCFGCEGVFTTGPAESIAETVLLDAAKKNPKKAQSQYLLGYLRREQGRGAEAAGFFRRAVELDPDYLNAWKELSGLSETGTVSMAESEQIVLNMIRLDPRERHGQVSESSIRLKSFAKFYDAVNSVYKLTAPNESIYELSAAKARIKAMGDQNTYYYEKMMKSPGSKIALIEPIRSVMSMSQIYYSRGMY